MSAVVSPLPTSRLRGAQIRFDTRPLEGPLVPLLLLAILRLHRPYPLVFFFFFFLLLGTGHKNPVAELTLQSPPLAFAHPPSCFVAFVPVQGAHHPRSSHAELQLRRLRSPPLAEAQQAALEALRAVLPLLEHEVCAPEQVVQRRRVGRRAPVVHVDGGVEVERRVAVLAQPGADEAAVQVQEQDARSMGLGKEVGDGDAGAGSRQRDGGFLFRRREDLVADEVFEKVLVRHDRVFRLQRKRTEEGQRVEPEGADLGSCEWLVGAGLRGEELPGWEFVAQGR